MKTYQSLLSGVLSYCIAIGTFNILTMLLRLLIFDVNLNLFSEISIEVLMLLCGFLVAIKLFKLSMNKNLKFLLVLIGILILFYFIRLWLNNLISIKISSSSSHEILTQAMELTSLQGILELALGALIIIYLIFRSFKEKSA